MSTIPSLSFKTLLKNLLTSTNSTQYLIILGMLIVVAAVGLCSAIYYKGNNPIEKVAEHIIEQELESTLHLPDGTLDGKINLNPDNG